MEIERSCTNLVSFWHQHNFQNRLIWRHCKISIFWMIVKRQNFWISFSVFRFSELKRENIQRAEFFLCLSSSHKRRVADATLKLETFGVFSFFFFFLLFFVVVMQLQCALCNCAINVQCSSSTCRRRRYSVCFVFINDLKSL